jgi:hypothetical protein
MPYRRSGYRRQECLSSKLCTLSPYRASKSQWIHVICFILQHAYFIERGYFASKLGDFGFGCTYRHIICNGGFCLRLADYSNFSNRTKCAFGTALNNSERSDKITPDARRLQPPNCEYLFRRAELAISSKADDLQLGLLWRLHSAFSCQVARLKQLPATPRRLVTVTFQPVGGQPTLRVHTRAVCSEGMWWWVAEAESQ